MKKDCYIYPAIFKYESGIIEVSFPDLVNCRCLAMNDEEAFFKARNALRSYIVSYELINDDVPKASELIDIKLNKNERVSLIQIDMPLFREAISNRSVKKNLTIPSWLNAVAEREDVNFSYVLQKALKDYMHLKEPC